MWSSEAALVDLRLPLNEWVPPLRGPVVLVPIDCEKSLTRKALEEALSGKAAAVLDSLDNPSFVVGTIGSGETTVSSRTMREEMAVSEAEAKEYFLSQFS